jgi:hypothetical protein
VRVQHVIVSRHHVIVEEEQDLAGRALSTPVASDGCSAVLARHHIGHPS